MEKRRLAVVLVGVVLLMVVFGFWARPAQAAAPANDDRANALVLPDPAAGSLDQTTVDATKELGEGDHAGDAGGASVWFTWVPSFSGAAMVSTSGSDFDTLLDIRDAADVVLASNDDLASSGPGSRASLACFTATAGAPVTFAVDGYAGDTGNLHLSWGQPDPLQACPGLPPVVNAGANEPTVGDTLTVTSLGTRPAAASRRA